jgi:transketolase
VLIPRRQHSRRAGDLEAYAKRAEAFGWHAIVIDGHDVDAIEAAYAEAESTKGRPTAIFARTMKGKGVKAVENLPGKHGQPLDDPEAAIQELGGERDLTVRVTAPEGGEPHAFDTPGGELPSWDVGEQEATRKAYGLALKALGDLRGDVVALDGEVSNSTHSEEFAKAQPDRYFEMFIAEQQLVSATVGLQVGGRWVPFASTFAAFFSRAYDFVRMAAVSRADIRLAGSHPGVSIGEDGPSQMALRTRRRSARSTAPPCCTPPTSTRPPSLSPRWSTGSASRSCGRCGARRPCARRRTRR